MLPEEQSTTELTQEAFEAAMRAVEPNLLLAQPWLLQAVIHYDLELLPTGLATPDEQLYVIDRQAFLRFIQERELPLPEGLPSGETLILLEKPESDDLHRTPPPQLLLRYWRLLTRAKVEACVRRELQNGSGLYRPALDERIGRIGDDIFNEARHVLRRERRLTSGFSFLDAYAKFVAAFVEIQSFSPRLLPHVFPSIEDVGCVEEVVRTDVPMDLVARLRPAGAAAMDEVVSHSLGPPLRRPSLWNRLKNWFAPIRQNRAQRNRMSRAAKRDRAGLAKAADQSAEVGNHVRSALLRARAYRGSGDRTNAIPAAALSDLAALARRLAAALGQEPHAAREWRDALRPLLNPASLGWWSAERRLLYDLQRVCIDHEREIYSVNVVEWLLELCRRPLYRPLPRQRLALAARRLKTAAHRLTRCRMPASQRSRLDHLLHEAYHDAEHHLRQELTPGIEAALDRVDLRPRNTVESVARQKMVQEMLDAIVRDGYLTFGGVRDAISRNGLRCDDLRSPAEWIGYDQLMKLDRRLGDNLDGVYRRGEIYRYAFQKLSSWMFANPPGRLLTRTVILPVAGAYLLLEALQHTVGTLLDKVFHVRTHLLPVWKSPDPVADPDTARAVASHFDPATLYTNPRTFIPLAITTVLLLLLINWPAFRKKLAAWCAAFFRGLGVLLFEVPEKFFKHPAVRAVMGSQAFRLIFRYGVKPLVFVLIAWWLLPHNAPLGVEIATFAAVFLVINLVVNSRPGRAVEEAFLYTVRVGWVRFTLDKIATIFRGIMYFFERMMETIDRLLYAVDEWLRFRGGSGNQSLWGKAILGIIWFYIAYVFRFALNLLVEPQINPIKHFPVVTVSHKLLLPLAIPPGGGNPSPLGGVLMWMTGASRGTADATAATIVWGIPGIFGFLAWELKENWKLYRANMPKTVNAVRFGSHGESVAQLLRPGFHSGTLPKAFAKLRKAHRRAEEEHDAPAADEFPLTAHKQLEAIEHVDEDLRRFVDRAFLALLNRHPAFASTPVELLDTKLGVTRIVLLLACPVRSAEPLRLEFEQIAGWIVGETREKGWSETLNGEEVRFFQSVLRGLYKMAAVDVVREDIDAAFAPLAVSWELRSKKLVVRLQDQPEVEVSYKLYDSPMRPDVKPAASAGQFPVLPQEQVLLRKVDLQQADWEANFASGSRVEVVPATMGQTSMA